MLEILLSIFRNEKDELAKEVLFGIRKIRGYEAVDEVIKSYPVEWIHDLKRLFTCKDINGVKKACTINTFFKLEKTIVHGFSHRLFDRLAFLRVVIPIIHSHKEVLVNKKKRLIYKDEFGDSVSTRWNEELTSYFKTKIEHELSIFYSENRTLRANFERVHEHELDSFYYLLKECDYRQILVEEIDELLDSIVIDNAREESFVVEMTGLEYEYYLANRINTETDWTAEVTKGSGDQGADLLINDGEGINCIVQAKYYAKNVGNKAVQEAFSARQYYNANFGFVVTNSFFTPSAIELAESLDILLFQDDEFIKFLNARWE